jgi:hypothetical protein
MRFDLVTLLTLVGQSLRDPAAVAEQIVKLRLPHTIGWMGLGAVTILTVIAISAERFLPGSPDMLTGLGQNPFTDTVFLGSMTVLFVFVLYYAGLALGGKGSFGSTLLIMTWFQTIVLCLVVVQLLAIVIVPSLALLVSLAGFGLQLWCLMHFLNVLHGFDSLGKAFGLFAISIIGFAFGLSFILLLVGGATLVGGPM